MISSSSKKNEIEINETNNICLDRTSDLLIMKRKILFRKQNQIFI